MTLGTFRVRSGYSRLLLGAFLLYLFGVLGFQGLSHRHEASSSQADCQLCQISSQPFLAATPPPHPLLKAIDLAPAEAGPEQVRPPRHFHFSSRAPPSV
jgi:hypothetical protein